MKPLLILIVAWASTAIGKAQKISFTDPGNMWIYTYPNPDNPPQAWQYAWHFTYDTTINYKGHIWTLINGRDSAYVREDTFAKKVFARVFKYQHQYTGDTNEVVLYDYNLSLGDTFKIRNPIATWDLVVTSVDSLLINSVFHKRLTFLRPGFSQPRCLEGIGSDLEGPLYFYNPYSAEYAHLLTCFKNQGLPVSEYLIGCIASVVDIQNTFTISVPNPATHTIFLKEETTLTYSKKKLVVRDVMGREMIRGNYRTETIRLDVSALPPGIYAYQVVYDDGKYQSVGNFIKQ
jgi:hypothetical protein